MASCPIQLDPFQWRTGTMDDDDDETLSIPPWTECQALKSQLMDLVLTEREEFLQAIALNTTSNPPDKLDKLDKPESPLGESHEVDLNPSQTPFEPKSTSHTSVSCRVEADLRAIEKATRELFRVLDLRSHSRDARGAIVMTEGDAQGLTKRKKRDKDFQTRWKRSLYDLTQKINQTKVAILRLNICGEAKKKLSENSADTKLHLALRQLLSVLKMVLAQAPFLCSRSKESNFFIEIFERISEVSKLCSQLGYAHPDLVSSLQGLENMLGMSNENKTWDPTCDPTCDPTAKSSPVDALRRIKTTLPRIDLINNLAMEKFGSSPNQSLKKANSQAPSKSTLASNPLISPAEARSLVGLKEKESDSASGFVLELSDYDLENIHQSRRDVSSWDLLASHPCVFLGGERFSGPNKRGKKEQDSSNPVHIVRALSDDIVDHLVLQVCEEMTQDRLVLRVVDEELANS